MIHYQLAGRNSGPADAYEKAEAALRNAERCAVVNSRLTPGVHAHDAAYYSIKTLIEEADALVRLPGWENGKLSVLEVAVANAVGIPVTDLEDHL